jgi:hypothetical protein
MALLGVARVGTNRRRVIEPSQGDATHIEWHQRISGENHPSRSTARRFAARSARHIILHCAQHTDKATELVNLAGRNETKSPDVSLITILYNR